MSPIKILVVDDAADMRSFLAESLLRAEGYETYMAEDGAAGLEMALRVVPDVIVADIHMPRLSGLEMARQLAQAGSLIPVILITVESTEPLARQALQAGVAGYLLKPFEPEELLAAIRRALGRAQLAQEHARERAELEAVNAALRQRVQELEALAGPESEAREAFERRQSTFIRAVSHDLRTPLTAILAYVDLLRRAGPLNTAQEDFVRRIHVSAQAIIAVVNDLIELARVEAEGKNTGCEVTNLQSIARWVVDDWRSQAEGNNLAVELRLPEDAVNVRGEPARLRQMLSILLSNAIQYSHNGGTIKVSVRREGEEAVIDVSDTGMGIHPAEQPYVFDKFYRASNARQTSDGTGLGLAIVKAIVHNHGGRLRLDSALNAGTTISVYLPPESDCA